MDGSGEVDPKDRAGGVWDWVDQGLDEVAGVGAEPQISASEGDDSGIFGFAGGDGEAV